MILFVLLAISSGVISIVNRMFSVEAQRRVGLMNAMYINYIGAAIFSLLFALVLGSGDFYNLAHLAGIPPIYYAGGVVGLLQFILQIYLTPKVPVIYSTVITMVGQLTTGLVVDIIGFGIFSPGRVVGVALVGLGICLDNVVTTKQKQQVEEGEKSEVPAAEQ